MLLLGAWVGGRHSDWLPGPLRDALVGDGDTAVVTEAIDRIHDTYYREIPKSALADDAIAGVVAKLDDRFSNYFNPAEYKRFQDAQNAEFSGVGLQVAKHPKGLRVERGLRRLAREARRPARGRRHRRRRRARPGRDVAGRLGRPDQGPAGQRREADLASATAAARRRPCRARRSTVPVVASQLRSERGCKVGGGAPLAVQLGRARRGLRRAAQAAEARRQGLRARPARQRRRPGQRGAADRVGLPPRRADRHHARARGPGADAARHRRSGGARRSRSSCSSTSGTASASEIVTGALQDRERAKVVGTRHVRQGRLPGGHRAVQRRRARHHRRAVLHAERAATSAAAASSRARASRPTCPPRTIRRRRADEALDAGAGRRGRRVPVLTHAPPRRRPAREARPLPRRRRRSSSAAAGIDGGARRATRGPGDLVAAAHQPAKGGRAKIARVLGRPDVARDVHRGADARPRAAARASRPAVERARRGRAAAPTSPAARPARPADVHDRPGDRARLRRRDLRRGARRRALARVGAHRRRHRATCGPARRSTARPTGARRASTCPARSSRCCPRRSPTTPARSCPGDDRLAVTVELELRGAEP